MDVDEAAAKLAAAQKKHHRAQAWLTIETGRPPLSQGR
jgi:hypothetical protein